MTSLSPESMLIMGLQSIYRDHHGFVRYNEIDGKNGLECFLLGYIEHLINTKSLGNLFYNNIIYLFFDFNRYFGSIVAIIRTKKRSYAIFNIMLQLMWKYTQLVNQMPTHQLHNHWILIRFHHNMYAYTNKSKL